MKTSFTSILLIFLCFILALTLASCQMLKEVESADSGTSVTETDSQEDSDSEDNESSVDNADDTESVTDEVPVILEITESTTFSELLAYVKHNSSLETIDATPVTITAKQYITLCEAAPEAKIVTKVDFEGLVMDLSLSEIDISGNKITDKASFDALLSHIPEGIKLIMCDCGYENEEMQTLREKYASLDFVWRLYLGKWSLRTDDEAFSVLIYASDVYTRMTSEDIEVLKYCTNLYALDLGHQAITDVTVLGEISTLRVLILADNEITDITPLGKLENLQYLELFVNRIRDLSPLASCTKLVDLNFGWNSVYDLSSIYSLEKIERLWLPTNPVPESARESIKTNFSDAQIVFEDENSISSGWRTHERYFMMRTMFNTNKYNENFVK